ncbi:MAG: MFS transporter [Gammaproteobacteria bacterium]|nr:MFS transporter [Gammaproteobacteria bacterium]
MVIDFLQKKPYFTKQAALHFIVLLGLVSFFADITSDGARSVIGPYLGILGASATIVGFVAGFSELIGYGFRIFSGIIVELTGNYWALALIGYGATLIAVPMFALAHHWELAAILLMMERFGKAMRSPARDVMIAHASQKVGRGWGFGLHKALDQAGATLGPLVVMIVLALHGSYRHSFFILIIPVALALIVLFMAHNFYPKPGKMESVSSSDEEEVESGKNVRALFWLYTCGAALVAAGYVDFPLMAYHFQKEAIFSPIWIPVLYSVALGASGITALIFGRWYDHRGFYVLIVVTILSACFAPLVFFGDLYQVLFGMFLWGLGLGVQVALLRAVIANMTSTKKRGSAYGFFNGAFGVAWFLGSALMGMLYSTSLLSLVLFSVVAQLAAIPLFIIVKNKL